MYVRHVCKYGTWFMTGMVLGTDLLLLILAMDFDVNGFGFRLVLTGVWRDD